MNFDKVKAISITTTLCTNNILIIINKLYIKIREKRIRKTTKNHPTVSEPSWSRPVNFFATSFGSASFFAKSSKKRRNDVVVFFVLAQCDVGLQRQEFFFQPKNSFNSLWADMFCPTDSGKPIYSTVVVSGSGPLGQFGSVDLGLRSFEIKISFDESTLLFPLLHHRANTRRTDSGSKNTSIPTFL